MATPTKPAAAVESGAPARADRRQVGLRHLMILSALSALVLASVAQAYRTGSDTDILLAILTTGGSLAGLGGFLVQRLPGRTGLGWFLVGIGPVGASVALVGASSEWNIYAIVATLGFEVPIVFGAIVHLVGRRRDAHQEAVLWVLALAADRGRPLGPAIRGLAGQSGGVDRASGMNLAECLDSGLSPPDALDFVPRSSPPADRLLARVGHDSGRLAEALREAASGRSSRPPGWRAFGAKVGYLCMIALFLQAILAFILYFIVPRFEAILRDFNIDLPRVTSWTIRASRFLTEGFALPILAMAEGLVLAYLPFAFAGFGSFHVPVLDRLFLRRHSALVLRCLAMVVDGDRPIGAGLESLARWYPADWVRERLAGSALAAGQGHDWIEALRHFGLIGRAEAAVLESSRRVGNLPWALRELSEGAGRKFEFRLQAIGQVLLTVALLTIGLFVGFLAVAFFYPLVVVIERLAR